MKRGVLLGLALACATPAAAQGSPPQADPGGVATVIAVAGPGPDSVRFRAAAAEGVRLFSEAEGTVRAAGGQDLRIPVTFGLPTRVAAGPFAAVRLDLEWSDGGRESRELLVDVAVQRRVGFWLDDAAVTAPAGTVADVAYRVRNEGNAADTFRIRVATPSTWATDLAPAAVILEAGAEATGTVGVRVPSTSSRGAEHMIRIAAAGTDVHETRSARLMVVGEASRVGNLATVPGSLFVGSSAGDEGTASAVALSAAGEIQPGTRVTLDLRHNEGRAAPPAFRGAMGGPRLRLGLEGAGWTARAGDLFTTPDLVTGTSTHGRGLAGSAQHGPLRTEFMAARPWSYQGQAGDGHVFRAAARYNTSIGSIGARAASVQRASDFTGGYRQAGASLTYAYRAAGHDIEAEAGVLRVVEGSGDATGPAAQVRYVLSQGRLSLHARLRSVPAATAGTHGNEAFVTGDVGISETVSLTGSAHTAGSPRVDDRPYSVSDGASAGLRLRLPARVNVRLLGAYRSNEVVGSGLDPIATQTAALGVSAPVAGMALEADAHAGRSSHGGADRLYHDLRVGGRWSHGADWAWVGLAHHDFGTGVRHTRLDMAGAVRIHTAELQAGLDTRVDAGHQLRRASFWSAATVPVMDDTRLSIGVEHRGYFQAGPWRLSLGATRSFGLPLPVARSPVVSGVVFEDLDADGVRRPGDPGVPGVTVSLGHLQTITDERGHFRFYDTAGGDLRVGPAGLPMGVVVGPGAKLPSRGQAAIPLIRTASLEIRLFLDRNGNGAADPGDVAAQGIVLSLRDEDGTVRDAVSDSTGRVRFAALPPGSYTVVVQPPSRKTGEPPIETRVVLRPAHTGQVVIAVPIRTREIRLPNGASLDPLPSPLTLSAPSAVETSGHDAPVDQSGNSTSRAVSDDSRP